MDTMVAVFSFVLGTIFGSFLNVCIVRMPEEKSIIRPPSHCVSCKRPIAWHDNIPLVSFIILRGRCRYCNAKISIRYFIVEVFTGIVFLGFYLYFGLQWILIPYLIFICGLIIATFVDIKHRIIPDEISIGGIVIGIVLSAAIPSLHDTSSILFSVGRSLLGVVVGGGSIYIMGMIGDFVFKKETMGGGDVKLLGMIGAFLGWQAAILTFFIAPVFGAIVGIVVKIRTKESLIPYGPFLALGAVISLFWSRQIIDFILGGYGLY